MKKLVVIAAMSFIFVPVLGAAPALAGRDIIVKLDDDDDYHHHRRHYDERDYHDEDDYRPPVRYKEQHNRIGYLLGQIAGQKIKGEKRGRTHIVYDDVYQDDRISVQKAVDARTGKRVLIVRNKR